MTLDMDLYQEAVAIGRMMTPLAEFPPDLLHLPPALSEPAFHGLAGDVVRTIEPYTEADPAGLLLTFLAAFGNEVGPDPHVVADGAEHPARLNVVLVGETARSRKGSTSRQIFNVFEAYMPGFHRKRAIGGLGSGEGLIRAVADLADEGRGVPRLIVEEPEFSRILAVAGREGSVLSPVIREAWDGTPLRVTTRKDPLRADPPHMVSILAHVTCDELVRRLNDVEIANGFANRFLFASVRRSKLLPNAPVLDHRDRLGPRVGEARRVGLMKRTPGSEALWVSIYEDLETRDPGGLLGAVVARASAQTLRLSVTYALLDGSSEIDIDHLEAAYAVWRYCEDSGRRIFGESLGDPVADKLLRAVQDAGNEGLDFSAQRALFSRHISAHRLDSARHELERRGLVVTTPEETAGRPKMVTRAIASHARKAHEARKAPL